MDKKRMIIAMILSFLWSGLGLIYAEDMMKGAILAVFALIGYLLMFKVNQIFGMFVFIVWIYSLYATFKYVRAVKTQ